MMISMTFFRFAQRRGFAAIGFALLLSLAVHSAQAATPAVGQKAPDFTLSTPEGVAVHFADLTAKGDLVLILLRGYPGYQCPYCQKQIHDFIASADQFAKAGAQILLVYPGPPADLDQRAREAIAKANADQKLPANFHLVMDPDYAFTNLYDLRWEGPKETAYPSTFLVNRKGNILFAKTSHSHGDRTTATDTLSELMKAHLRVRTSVGLGLQ
jgi:peroxiredoxin